MSTIIAPVSITRIRPVRQHTSTPAVIPIGNKEKTGVAGNDPIEWRHTVRATGDGQRSLKPPSSFGCLHDGAKVRPLKRGTLQPLLAGTLLVRDRTVPLAGLWLPDARTTDDEQPIYLAMQRVCNPATRALRHGMIPPTWQPLTWNEPSEQTA